MEKTNNCQCRIVTLSEFNNLINNAIIAKYKITNDYKFQLIFDKMKIFLKPNTIFFSNCDGTYFCIRSILLIEESDGIFRIHTNKFGNDEIITIIPINTN